MGCLLLLESHLSPDEGDKAVLRLNPVDPNACLDKNGRIERISDGGRKASWEEVVPDIR
jgi:hypothetical protein